MLFNQIEFLIFLPIVFSIYWLLGSERRISQNLLIVVASYFFYGWWDWRFLGLIAFSSLIDFWIAILLGGQRSNIKRKCLLAVSIFVNLGFLAFFKYFNFFSESLSKAFTFMGESISDPVLLNIVLPVGISFYTFQTLSYSIDVYRKKLEPTKSVVTFFAYVSFFPQLVAGPIERATHLLPQFTEKRKFDYSASVDGLRQVLWGLFKKVVIADNCAYYANEIFSNYENYSASTLFLGAVLFAFQIYGDFSGYSDIAIGVSRLFGFNLMRNFAFPYFSRDIAEFWRRWHISLSSWFRDYVYIPLGGSRGGKWINLRNIFIIFVVSGFWHGANWTFIVWGTLNALYFIPLMLLKKNRVNTDQVAEGRYLPSLKEVLQMGSTFGLTLIAWIFFRSESVGDATAYLSQMFSPSLFSYPEIIPRTTVILVLIFIFIEWIQRSKQHALDLSEVEMPTILRWAIYYLIIFSIIQLGGQKQEFIYFQF